MIGGGFDTFKNFLDRIELLIQTVIVVAGLAFIVSAAFKSKGAFIPIITMTLTVAAFIWGAFHIQWITDKLNLDADDRSGGQVDLTRFGGTVAPPDWLGRLADGRAVTLRGATTRGG